MTTKELRKLLTDPILIVLVGNVGTGKSFITSKLKNILNAEILSGDELSKERKSSNRGNHGYISIKMEEFLISKISVIIDNPNLTNINRDPFLLKSQILGVSSLVIDCGPGTNEDLVRRQNENRGYSNSEWAEQFYKNREIYQKPTQKYFNQYVIDKWVFLSHIEKIHLKNED